MNIYELESVCAVDRYRNYSEAAFRLSVSVAAISKHISKVEKELGVRIFQRASKSHPVELTKQGAEIMKYLHDIVDTWAGVTKLAADMSEGRSETVTVGYVQFVGSFRESEILSDFTMRCPNTVLYRKAGHSRDLIDMLLTGTADALFLPMVEGADTHNSIYASLDFPDIGVEPVLENDVLTIGVSEKHPLAKCSVITKTQFPLLYNDTFLFSNEQRGKSWATSHGYLYDTLGFTGKMKLRYVDFSEPSIALTLVREGYGVLPQACITPAEIDGVHFIPVQGWNTKTSLYFIYRKSSSEALKELKACVRDFRKKMK